MPEETTYSKMKLIFVNVYSMLLCAAHLNVFRLYNDIRNVKVQVDNSETESWIREIFTFLISGLVVVKFCLCFLGLASYTVAIFPILTNSQAELLMPAIIIQAVDNVILNLYEIVLGYGSLCYLYPTSIAVFLFFLVKMVVKIALSISVLNIYSDHHNHLASLAAFQEESTSIGPDSLNEVELTNQNFDFS